MEGRTKPRENPENLELTGFLIGLCTEVLEATSDLFQISPDFTGNLKSP